MKKIFKNLLIGASVLTMTFSAAACNLTGATGSAENYAYVTVDINPSIELVVKDNKIVGVKALNDDAAVLLSGENIIGLTVEEATQKITALAEALGYLTDENPDVKITVLADDAEFEQRVEGHAKKGAKKGSQKAEVNTDPRAEDERTVRDLKEKEPDRYEDLTPEKCRLIEAIMRFDDTMTYEIGVEMSVKELAKLLDDLMDEYEDVVGDTIEEMFEDRYNERKKELEGQIAEIIGVDYYIAWQTYENLQLTYRMIEQKAENAVISTEHVDMIVEYLGLDDATALQDKDGNVTVESVERFLDRNPEHWRKEYHDHRPHVPECDFVDFDVEDAIEEILDSYDDDEYVLDAVDLDLLAGVWNQQKDAETLQSWMEEIGVETLEDLEEFVEEQRDALKTMLDGVELTEEQLAQIDEIKQQMRSLRGEVMEELRSEIDRLHGEFYEKKHVAQAD